MKILTNEILKELFPEHADYIEELGREMACGCACCVMGVLRAEFKLTLPEEWGGMDVICV